MTEFDRAAPPLKPIGSVWSRSLFDGPFWISDPPSTHLPAASLVFVQSREGNTGATDPSTLGGGATDKHLIYEGLSRVAADAVLAGAETVRSGNLVLSVWHPELVALRLALGLPRHPVQIVASLRGVKFDSGLMFNLPWLRVMIVTVPSCAEVMRSGLTERPWIQAVVMKHANDLPEAFRSLRAKGISRISAIGGRRIARALIDANLIQDLYLTTSPETGGEPDTPLYQGPLSVTPLVRKHGSGPEAGVVFEHLRLG